MKKKEILSQFLNGKISSEELRFELNRDRPLIFEIPIKEVHMRPELDAVGYYLDENDKKVYKPYSWYLEEKQNRSIAICLHPLPEYGEILTNI